MFKGEVREGRKHMELLQYNMLFGCIGFRVPGSRTLGFGFQASGSEHLTLNPKPAFRVEALESLLPRAQNASSRHQIILHFIMVLTPYFLNPKPSKLNPKPTLPKPRPSPALAFAVAALMGASQIRSTFLGVPIKRIRVIWGRYWAPPDLGKLQNQRIKLLWGD